MKHAWNVDWNKHDLDCPSHPMARRSDPASGRRDGTNFAQFVSRHMRVAIPTFGADISPRFCFAREMVVIDIVGGTEVGRGRVQLGDASWPERLAILTAQRVDVLLCGGFPRQYLPVAEAVGIQVVVGLAGTVEEILAAFRDGKVADLVAFPCAGQGQGGGMGHGRGGRPAVDPTKGRN